MISFTTVNDVHYTTDAKMLTLITPDTWVEAVSTYGRKVYVQTNHIVTIDK